MDWHLFVHNLLNSSYSGTRAGKGLGKSDERNYSAPHLHCSSLESDKESVAYGVPKLKLKLKEYRVWSIIDFGYVA